LVEADFCGWEATDFEGRGLVCRGLGGLSLCTMKKMGEKFGACQKTLYLCSVKNEKTTQNR
jgi:hypothetical protein